MPDGNTRQVRAWLVGDPRSRYVGSFGRDEHSAPCGNSFPPKHSAPNHDSVTMVGLDAPTATLASLTVSSARIVGGQYITLTFKL